MIRVAHIYASEGKSNSGDLMLGIATKDHFTSSIANNKKCTFVDFNCRDESLFTKEAILKLNEFDYVLIGGGGLILPDTAPNRISAWQVKIPTENYKLIKAPVYVIGLGYNLFYGQSMDMPKKNSNFRDSSLLDIFTKNISELIRVSAHFSMRHLDDVVNLKKIVSSELGEKITYSPCPTIKYVSTNWAKKIIPENRKFIGIEIKEDRSWRRYFNISKDQFYSELLKFIIFCKNKGFSIAIVKHENGSDFYEYTIKNGFNLPLLDNSCQLESKILENYSKLKMIFCTAGHSQMMSYALGIPMMSLISHPKLKSFCNEMHLNDYIEINQNFNIFEAMKKFMITNYAK